MKQVKNPIINIRKVFSNHFTSKEDVLNWSRIRKIIESRKQFDILYSMHETAFHFNDGFQNILNKYKNDGLTNPEFVYTAIAFVDFLDKISKFNTFLNVKDAGPRFKSLIVKSVTLKDKPLPRNERLINLINLMNEKNNVSHNRTESYYSRSILKIIRNKLVHPNSDKYKTIHILGNYSSLLGRYPIDHYFEFKSSFDTNKSFRVTKCIFIDAIYLLEKYVKRMVPKWNEAAKIMWLDIKKYKMPKYYTQRNIIEELKFYSYNDHERSALLQDSYQLADLYLIGKSLNNKDMMEFCVNSIYLQLYFGNFDNRNFHKLRTCDISLYQYRSNFIDFHHKACIDRSSSGYACEKIGSWEDWDAKRWFPNIFNKIDEIEPGDEPYEFRIYKFIARQVDWKKMNQEAINELEKAKAIPVKDFIDYMNDTEQYNKELIFFTEECVKYK